MADFRRLFIALAVIALMAFAASAQVGVATAGGPNSTFACNQTAAGNPQLRPEGYTELVGDIVISCTGGQNAAVGSAIPTTNITVYVEVTSVLTSRYMCGCTTGNPTSTPNRCPSDILLLIDEPGSGILTGASGSWGPNAPQTLCTSSQQGTAACQEYVGSVLGNDGVLHYEVAQTSGGLTGPNVFQGSIGDFGGNSVSFYGIPVLPPATNGVSRTYRVTNIRIPGTSVAPSQVILAVVSTNGPTTLPLNGTPIQLAAGGVATRATVKVSGANPFQQCKGVPVTTPAVTANLIFTEGFATAFKTRVIPGGTNNLNPATSPNSNTLYAAEATNTGLPYYQNIPGGLYGGFAQNSESGFIFPALTTNSSNGNYVAGLADYGTRLKAVFTNIPSGITLWVSVTSGGTAPSAVGGTSLIPYAVLVSTGQSEATGDGGAIPQAPAASGFTPIAGTTTGTDGLGAIALSPNGAGQYVAVWEVTNSNPSLIDALSFSAYISYSPQSGSGAVGSATYYGLPVTGTPAVPLPPGSGFNNVELTFAPEPLLEGAFTAANPAGPIPRFTTAPAYQGFFTEINLCQTTLLYPFVTGASGFDTGIAVANTSSDPWGTTHQTGSCTLYPYGLTVATVTSSTSPGTTPFSSSPIQGCDVLVNTPGISPLPGANCFPIVPSGQVQAVQASGVLPNFQGYVIAICNFQFAHGYAAVTDLGLRNIFSSYLALELNNAALGAFSRGTSGGGVQGIETLAH